MLKTAGSAIIVVAIGTVAIAWSQKHGPQQLIPAAETISPEILTLGHGPLPETKAHDMSVVFTGDN